MKFRNKIYPAFLFPFSIYCTFNILMKNVYMISVALIVSCLVLFTQNDLMEFYMFIYFKFT